MLRLMLTLLISLSIETAFAKKEQIFFISHAGAGDMFWNVSYQGLLKAKKDFGADVYFMAPETPNDVSRQVELLNAAIASKPDALAVVIPNDLSLVYSLQKAKDLGIPVVAVNSKPNPEAINKNPYLSFIGMDDYLAGKKVGEHAWESKKISKRVIVANHQPGHSGLESRLRGISESLTAKGVIVDKLDIGNDEAAVTNILQGYLNSHPDSSGIFCLGPPCVHAIGRYFHHKGQKIFQASFDLSPFTIQLIKEGIIDFTIDQEPFLQGYLSVRELVALIRDKKKPRFIDTGGSFVDQTNAELVFDLVKKGLR